MFPLLHHTKDSNEHCACGDQSRAEDGPLAKSIAQDDPGQQGIVDERHGAKRREDDDRQGVELEYRRKDVGRNVDSESEEPEWTTNRSTTLGQWKGFVLDM